MLKLDSSALTKKKKSFLVVLRVTYLSFEISAMTKVRPLVTQVDWTTFLTHAHLFQLM